MSVLRGVIALLCASLLACATPEGTARFSGLSREDTAAISAELRKYTSAPIVGYHREDDGTIDVWTDGDGLYTARKIRGKWKLGKVVVLT
jgi:hypothetical protein